MREMLILGSSDIWSDGVLKRRKPLNNCIFELAPTNMHCTIAASLQMSDEPLLLLCLLQNKH